MPVPVPWQMRQQIGARCSPADLADLVAYFATYRATTTSDNALSVSVVVMGRMSICRPNRRSRAGIRWDRAVVTVACRAAVRIERRSSGRLAHAGGGQDEPS